MEIIQTTITSRKSYQLPFGTDSSFGDLIVSEIGIPLINFYGDDHSAVPVKFTNGTYGIISCRGERADHWESSNPIVEAYIKSSATMPIITKIKGLQQSLVITVVEFSTNKTIIAHMHYNDDVINLDDLVSIN